MSSLSIPAAAALPPSSASARGTLRLLAASLILVPLTLSPLLWASVPPLVDYPNHLARMWILVQNGALPELARNYVVAWRVLPDLAMDLIVPALTRIMPLEIAGTPLHRAHHAEPAGRHDDAAPRAPWPRRTVRSLSALLFLYNAALFWGFLNCLFGIGMFLLALSGWISSRHWRAAPRILTFATVASLLLLLHLFAFCLYALAVGSYELGHWLRERQLSPRGFRTLCAAGLQFIPGLLLWLASLAESGPSYREYGDLGAKVYAVQAPFTFGAQAILFDKALVMFSAVFLLAAIASRALRLAPEMRLPLIAMLLAAVAMPNWMNGSWLADIRLPVALPFVLIASTRLDAARLRAVGWFAAVALVLLGVRIWAVSETWRDTDRLFAEFRSAARVITPGARLLIVDDTPRGRRPLEGVPSFLAQRWDESFPHMPALAVIDREAFIPYLFTGWTSRGSHGTARGLSQTQAAPLTSAVLRQSVTVEPGDPAYEQPDFLGELPYWGNWPRHFDFVLWIDFDSEPAPSLAALQPVAQGSFSGSTGWPPPS